MLTLGEECLLRGILRLVGFLIFIFGVFLIFTDQVFFGVLSIILAFLVFPNRSNSKSHNYHHYDNDYSNDHAYSSDSDSGGGDSGGGGGGD